MKTIEDKILEVDNLFNEIIKDLDDTIDTIKDKDHSLSRQLIFYKSEFSRLSKNYNGNTSHFASDLINLIKYAMNLMKG